MVFAGFGFAVAVIGFALSQWVWVSVVLLGFAGCGLVTVNAGVNTLVQTIADDDKRGRVLSLLMMCFLGMTPVGSLIFGELARTNRLGPSLTVIIGAGSVALATAWFAAALPKMRQHVRPILIRRGILVPIAVGLETQGELTAPPEQAG